MSVIGVDLGYVGRVGRLPRRVLQPFGLLLGQRRVCWHLGAEHGVLALVLCAAILAGLAGYQAIRGNDSVVAEMSVKLPPVEMLPADPPLPNLAALALLQRPGAIVAEPIGRAGAERVARLQHALSSGVIQRVTKITVADAAGAPFYDGHWGRAAGSSHRRAMCLMRPRHHYAAATLPHIRRA